jgi:2-keto-4-pentenoate hydratase
MSLPNESLKDAARAIREARSERQTIARISETFGISTVDEAYTIADMNNQMMIEAGHHITGKKVGLTAKKVQEQLGINEPDFGVLFQSMEFLHGDEVPFDRLIQPKVEGEIAVVIDRDMTQDPPSWGYFLSSLAYVVPAIEIVDSVITDWKITLVDTVADNASSALYVLGNQPVDASAFALDHIDMQLWINHNVASVGTGATCLGHPLRSAYWLACEMAKRGQPLKAGEVILSGSLGPMVPVRQGDAVSVQMGSLGTVSCQFV